MTYILYPMSRTGKLFLKEPTPHSFQHFMTTAFAVIPSASPFPFPVKESVTLR